MLKRNFVDFNLDNEKYVQFVEAVRDFNKIYIEKFRTDKEMNELIQGGFFDKTIKKGIDIDLTRYQIFHEYKKENYYDSCVVHAMKMAGLEEAKLDKIRLILKSRLVPQKVLADC